MFLPADSVRSRIVWSIPAALIIGLWTIGILGAGATSFPDPYTFPEVLSRIAHGGWRMIWPGEFGYHWYGFIFQFGPLIALILWAFCLVPWRTRARRMAALIMALLMPAGVLLAAPRYIIVGLTTAWPAIFGVGWGEEWQDGDVAVTGMAFWWWLLVPVILMTALRRISPQDRDHCWNCGYPTRGLSGKQCPECGNDFARD